MQLWVVRSEYIERSGRIFESGRFVRHFDPFQEVAAIGELAKVASGHLSPLDFSRRFGLLGYRGLAMRRLDDSRLMRTALRNAVTRGIDPEVAVLRAADRIEEKQKQMQGDPIDWIVAHARSIQTVLTFIEALEDGNTHCIREMLRTYDPKGPYAHLDEIVSIGSSYDEVLNDPIYRSTHPAFFARDLMGLFINANISRIYRQLAVGQRSGRVRSDLRFYGFIEVIYWLLADRAAKESGVRGCEYCGAQFVVTDERQRFCPPPPGIKQSPCGSRASVRRFRENATKGKKEKKK
jgi:hypothetical protein